MELNNVEIKELPRPAKIAAVHGLREAKTSIRTVARLLGISTASVNLYLKEIPDASYSEFSTLIKDRFKSKEHEIALKALNKMSEKIDKDQFLEYRDLLNTYKEFILPKTPTGPVIPIQINFKDSKYENNEVS